MKPPCLTVHCIGEKRFFQNSTAHVITFLSITSPHCKLNYLRAICSDRQHTKYCLEQLPSSEIHTMEHHLSIPYNAVQEMNSITVLFHLATIIAPVSLTHYCIKVTHEIVVLTITWKLRMIFINYSMGSCW